MRQRRENKQKSPKENGGDSSHSERLTIPPARTSSADFPFSHSAPKPTQETERLILPNVRYSMSLYRTGKKEVYCWRSVLNLMIDRLIFPLALCLLCSTLNLLQTACLHLSLETRTCINSQKCHRKTTQGHTNNRNNTLC